MTKEELEKESQQYTLSHTTPSLYRVVDQAYLAGAEPREKRIAELEAQIEIMKSCVNCRYCINEKCPWQPKGCGMKHWELKKVKEK